MARLLLLALLFATACRGGAVEERPAAPVPEPVADTSAAEPAVRVGAEVLASRGFEPLAGRRVGLIVNHTARVGEAHVIDLFHAAPEVELAALFGPEHGLRGDADAGEKVSDGRDDRTGVRVYSLYGETQKPTREMLADVDALVYDIQDVGARFYTYISTMGLAMQAAAEAGIPFYVLDRPNPLGGEQVAGFVLDPDQRSFVGLFQIPIVYGMTAGELARMIQGEQLLSGLSNLELHVVPMEGWRRTMLWPETGLPWIPTSPNIPDFETALVYAGTCLFEGTAASEGRGTQTPFRLLGAPWADADSLAERIAGYGLEGARVEPARFTPRSIEGMSSDPKLEGTPLQGIRITVTDAHAFDPVRTGVSLLHAFYEQAPPGEQGDFLDRSWLAKLAGTNRLYEMLRAGRGPAEIAAAWEEATDRFRAQRTPYLLYE